MNDLARRDAPALKLLPEHYRELLKKPLLALPREIRPAALKLWTLHRHLTGLESPMPLAGAVAVWMEDWGLDPADAIVILRRLTNPAKMAAHKFASDLMTALGSEAQQAIDRRRQEAAVAEQREKARRDEEAARAYRAANPNAPKLADLLAGVGSGVTDG